MYYCNVKTNIYNFCKGVSVVISFIVLKVCFERQNLKDINGIQSLVYIIHGSDGCFKLSHK